MLRRLRSTLVALAVVAGSGAAIAAAGRPAAAATLAVHVSGNQLLDGSGRPVRLLGVNRSGTEYACAQGWGLFDGPSDDASVAAMAGWHVNAVRVPLNEDCWLGINGVNPAYAGAAYQSAITAYVGRLHAAGLLAVLDLHWSAPGSTLATGQQVMADADHSPAFWASVGSVFKSDPAVVYDLYNEPHDISWSCWRDGCTTAAGWSAAGMQSLINALRSSGATQPALAGGLNWAGDLSQWLTWRPSDPAGQLAASAHIYNFSQCNTQSCWAAQIAPVAAQVPVVTGEIGEDDCAHTFIDAYMAWADTAGAGYLGWSWNTAGCGTGPALVTAYDGTPTAFGAGLRTHLAALAAVTPPTTTTAPAPTTTTTAPPATTTTTTVRAPTTTTTAPAPTTTTTAVTPIVRVAGALDPGSNPWWGADNLTVTVARSVSALTVELHVVRTVGLTFAGRWSTAPSGGSFTRTDTPTEVVYRFRVAPAGGLAAGTYIFSGAYNLTGQAHAVTGDRWVVSTDGPSSSATGQVA